MFHDDCIILGLGRTTIRLIRGTPDLHPFSPVRVDAVIVVTNQHFDELLHHSCLPQGGLTLSIRQERNAYIDFKSLR